MSACRRRERLLIGLVTDRDISIMVAQRHQSPWQLAVREAMTKSVVSCAPDDPIDKALKTFSDLGVRRLPVVDPAGHVTGLLSIDDLVLHAGQRGLPEDAVFQTLRSICGAKPAKRFIDEAGDSHRDSRAVGPETTRSVSGQIVT